MRGNIPAFIHITDGKVADVNVLDKLLPEAGAFYVMDCCYIDFERLYRFTLESAFFVVRTKTNVLLQRRYSHAVDHAAGVHSDQTVVLASLTSASAYPDAMRKVSFVDAETGKRLVFLTSNFSLPAATIAALYKQRWQVELFFSFAVHLLTRSREQEAWVRNCEKEEWRELVTAMTKAEVLLVGVANAVKNNTLSHEQLDEYNKAANDAFRTILDRIFIADAIAHSQLTAKWSDVQTQFLKDQNAMLLVPNMQQLKTRSSTLLQNSNFNPAIYT